MWSEPGSVTYTELLGCTAVSRVVYISWRGDSVSLRSPGGLADLVDSSLSQSRAVTGGKSIKIITREQCKRISRPRIIVQRSAKGADSY